VRIDWSDLADEPDDSHMARRARPTPDDPDAASRDQGNTAHRRLRQLITELEAISIELASRPATPETPGDQPA
jgi:hypothetical protein